MKNKTKLFFKKPKIFFIFLPLALFAFADPYSHLELFAQALNIVKANYFQPVKTKSLVYGAIKGLLKEADPHSHFLSPKDFKKIKQEAKGRFYGLGLEVEKRDGFLIAVFVFKNSPAKKAGFQPGDKIFKINDKNIQDLSPSEFQHLFRSRSKKKYQFTIWRSGQTKPINLYARPYYLKIPTVDFKEREKGLFYLRIYYFSEKTLLEINPDFDT